MCGDDAKCQIPIGTIGGVCGEPQEFALSRNSVTTFVALTISGATITMINIVYIRFHKWSYFPSGALHNFNRAEPRPNLLLHGAGRPYLLFVHLFPDSSTVQGIFVK